MSFPVEIVLKEDKKEGGLASSIQEDLNFPKAVASKPTVKQMCNLMARCITYFTMLVELLIIKNVKAVGVIRHKSVLLLRQKHKHLFCLLKVS